MNQYYEQVCTSLRNRIWVICMTLPWDYDTVMDMEEDEMQKWFEICEEHHEQVEEEMNDVKSEMNRARR